jgi:hypothetical protein
MSPPSAYLMSNYCSTWWVFFFQIRRRNAYHCINRRKKEPYRKTPQGHTHRHQLGECECVVEGESERYHTMFRCLIRSRLSSYKHLNKRRWYQVFYKMLLRSTILYSRHLDTRGFEDFWKLHFYVFDWKFTSHKEMSDILVSDKAFLNLRKHRALCPKKTKALSTVTVLDNLSLYSLSNKWYFLVSTGW